MVTRPWRNAFGLRGRIVGAVLVTTVATLIVAALTLLGPLEQQLGNAAKQTLKNDLSKTVVADFYDKFNPAYLPEAGVSAPGEPDAKRAKAAAAHLANAETTLASQVGATKVILFGYLDALGQGGRPLLSADFQTGAAMPRDDIARAFLTGSPQLSFGTIGGKPYVFEAVRLPARLGRRSDAVLVVGKSTDEIADAVHAVRRAFLYAAMAGLALTLLLAIPLAARLGRRLQRLRESAVRLAAEGVTAEEPTDRGRDEVGDLSRTFALMQRRLRHQEEARRSFVATASHELRTPLASLDVMLELLAEDLRDGDVDLEDAQELLDRARAQSKRLGRLAADLLDLSRIDAEVALRREPVELGELGRAVLAEFEAGALERGVSCVLHDLGDPVWALGDPGSVARILRILLDNALRVAPHGSKIAVSIDAGPEPSLTVSDDGPGVLPEERELIFERFKRGRDTGGEAGFGLGLAIGRELAERMGGRLALDESGASGARFTLILPLAAAPAEERPAPVLNL
jgi:signal transduction histidine kinase